MTTRRPILTITAPTSHKSSPFQSRKARVPPRSLGSLLTVECESVKPDWNRLGNIAIQIDKVLRTTVDVEGPARDIEVDKLALGRVLEFGELG